MNISDEAVEAAAETYLSNEAGEDVWHHDDSEAEAKRRARHILEAAAPHLLADAWDEGNIAGIFDLPSEKHATPNPYRSQS